MKETKEIKEMNLTKVQRLAAQADLLDQEASLIQKLDKLQLVANAENREEKINFLLKQMASPKKWTQSDGGFVIVETPHTTRARELQNLYTAVTMPHSTVDERLQILLHVKFTVKVEFI